MYYPPYIRVSGRVEVNVSVLTGLGAIGNYNQHATARVLVDGRVYDVPVMTGNALKHWHSVYMAEVYEALGGKNLNELCRRGIGFRGYKVDANYSNPQSSNNECEAIKDLCNDIHGFLVPDKQIKRDSLIKASFLIPVLARDNVETVSKFAVQHNRVIPSQVKAQGGQQGQGMMIFKQEYATASYGFGMSMNLGLSLIPQYDTCDVNLDGLNLNDEKILRIKSAIMSILNLLAGSGSKQARALPITSLKELVIVVSNVPIPNLIHGAYIDYVTKSLDALNAFISQMNGNAKVDVLCYGTQCSGKLRNKDTKLEVKDYDELRGLFDDAITKALEFVTKS